MNQWLEEVFAEFRESVARGGLCEIRENYLHAEICSFTVHNTGKMCSKQYTFCHVSIMAADYHKDGPAGDFVT